MITSFINYDLPQYDDFIDRIVSFVDILGFDSRVRNIKSKKDFNEVAALLFVLNEIAKKCNIEDTHLKNLNILFISDSLILSIPFQDVTPSVMTLTVFLHMLQYELLNGFETLVRGYVTRGPVYHKDNIIFGKGYSKAYMKERDIGHAPRIVIEQILVHEAKDNISSVNYVDHILNYIIEDSSDGYYFIDYLKPVGTQPTKSSHLLIKERIKIKKFIQRKLIEYSKDDKIIRKYNWLNTYFALTEQYYLDYQGELENELKD